MYLRALDEEGGGADEMVNYTFHRAGIIMEAGEVWIPPIVYETTISQANTYR